MACFSLHLYSAGTRQRADICHFPGRYEMTKWHVSHEPVRDVRIPTAVSSASCTSGAVITAGRSKKKLKTRQPYFLTSICIWTQNQMNTKFHFLLQWCQPRLSLYYMQWFAWTAPSAKVTQSQLATPKDTHLQGRHNQSLFTVQGFSFMKRLLKYASNFVDRKSE